ncbi:MAG TPA: peptidoglycan DD-metalloendopeptidase family protein [Actinomycetota bacterium]|jgi:murein DD-endopeptidase MepM/ murein hydrolase activator NlpD|nr:peptidoglycan DD-metalloendopeptidase family protein [Actinomycetota bacterium]
MAHSLGSARPVLRRAPALLAALALVSALGQVASAEPGTREKLEAAEHELERLEDRIVDQKAVLGRLSEEIAVAYGRWEVANARYEQITEELANTRRQLRDAQEEYQALQGTLEERAREAYIVGPGSELEFLLGASTIADLSARMEYVNALNEEDADLATEVQNLRNMLAAEKADQEALQAKRERALEDVETQLAVLDGKLDEQQAILEDLNAAKERARQLVKRLDKKLKRELAALLGIGKAFNGVFKYCPIDEPRALYDGFGAPRYGGGYHPHAGNDIIAPQGTPIRATFDGYAQAGYNGLGGYAVNVYGDLGYTYNAHLMQIGYSGPVVAGQIIGYAGETGDTATPHLHFEWHPNVIPSDWPPSPYGYSVIGGAINPFPLLVQVC